MRERRRKLKGKCGYCEKHAATICEWCEMGISVARVLSLFVTKRPKPWVKKQITNGYCLKCGKHKAHICDICLIGREFGIPCSKTDGKEAAFMVRVLNTEGEEYD